MKIIYIITRATWGGAQAHLFDLIKYTHDQKLEVTLIVGDQGELTERVQQLGIKVMILPSLVREIQPVKDLKCVLELTRIMKKEKPDLVHVHSSKAGIVGRIAAKLSGVPVIFTAHGWPFTDGISKKRKMVMAIIERFVAKCTNKIICVSEYDKQLADRYRVGNPQLITMIHNGVEMKKTEQPKRTKPRIIMVARFSPPKDYETVTLALSKIKGDFEAVYVGDGELMPENRQLIVNHHLEQKVKLLGMRKDVNTLLQQSDVFILCSNYEGLPISVIEAMAMELPIIASNVGGVSELVEHEKNGFLIGRKDIDGLTRHIQYLLDHPEIREEMGKTSYQKYQNEFTLSAMLKQTFHVYHEVLSEKDQRKR